MNRRTFLSGLAALTAAIATPITWVVAGTRRFFNVKDYGAVGDGISGDRAAFHAAAEDAIRYGGTVYVPPGLYKYWEPRRSDN